MFLVIFGCYGVLNTIKDLRSSWDINKESFGDMLQAEYVFFIEHDFNRAISIYKDTLRKNPLYPVFISLHEICSISLLSRKSGQVGL